MKTPPRKKLLTQVVSTALFTGLCSLAPQVHAANWNLSNIPLGFGNSVPANVLLLVDDSGSMDWEIMSADVINDGLLTKNNASAGNCNVYAYGVTTQSGNIGGCDGYGLAEDTEWRFRNSNFNPLYFDPTKEYPPWSGFNSNGTTKFQNMDVHAALANPWTGWTGSNSKNGNEAIDLTAYNSGGLRYYTWADGDSDGKFDNGEETEYELAKASAAVQQKFANWFTYYRSRHLVAKAAFGSVIASNTINGLRVGMATLHNNGTVRTPLALIDNTPAGEVNRQDLLNHLYKNYPGGWTPLQDRLRQAGEYLAGNSANTLFPNDTAAPLSAAQGGACQKNFTLLMTDGFYNDSANYNDGNIGNADGDSDSQFDSTLDKTPFPKYGDAAVNSLGDIAMYYYEKDMFPSVANKVTATSTDAAPHQHMVTYTVAFGVTGNLKGTPEEYSKNSSWGTWPGWPGGTSSNSANDFDDLERVDDLIHAAYNGRGSFLSATTPGKLIAGVETMLKGISNENNSGSAAAFNATSLSTNSVMFQAVYKPSDWSSDFNFKKVTTAGVVVEPAIANASTVLTATAASARQILSINTTTGAGIAFTSASLSAAQAALVDADTVNYLRGDRSCEVGSKLTCASKNKRPRTKLLGDIVNSSPAYVSVPDENYYSDSSYLQFISDKSTRTPVVYVGANDGMLHGFNASATNTGTEVLAYVPGAVYNNLASLANPTYSHRFFVDASPVVADAKFGTQWRSILLSGLRGGGQAMFALDVTDPSTFSESNAASIVKWEFSDVNDADLGYTYGEPAIAKMADGSWAAIFGNGYNNTQADGRASTTGNAALYVVNLDTGALIKKISTYVGTAQDPDSLSRPNGLSGVRVMDVDGDSVVDYVYAGDLFGNLWRFDVTSATPSLWNTGPGTPGSAGTPGTPLYKAVNAAGKAQPITVRPTIGPHDLGLNRGYMVHFGTGKLLETADNATTGQQTQTFYGIWDQWPKNSVTGFTAFTRTNLQPQTIVAEVALPNGNTGRVTSSTKVDWLTKKGWYMDLAVGAASNNGERVIYDAVLHNGQVLFSTFIPNISLCDKAGGYVTILEASGGTSPSLPPIDINGDSSFSKDDLVTIGSTSYVVSGYKSLHGVPSAPFIVESAGGTADYIGVSYSDGHTGGIYDPTAGAGKADAPAGPLNASPDLMSGRVTWGRVK